MLKHHSLPLVSAVNNLCTPQNDKLPSKSDIRLAGLVRAHLNFF